MIHPLYTTATPGIEWLLAFLGAVAIVILVLMLCTWVWCVVWAIPTPQIRSR